MLYIIKKSTETHLKISVFFSFFSLSDITENQDESEEKKPVGLRRQRRNSWGSSGIPRPVDNNRASKSPPQYTPPNDEDMFEEGSTPESTPTTPGSKLPPLLSMLMPKSRGKKKSADKKKGKYIIAYNYRIKYLSKSNFCETFNFFFNFV